MKITNFLVVLLGAALAVLLGGCATAPKDYTQFRRHFPKSILVLPPINDSSDVEATYGVYPTTAMPLAEQGYYVFPPYLVDKTFRENGLPMPADMHAAPLSKIREVFGADAVLYMRVKQYGSKYVVLSSTTTVALEGRLVDVATGLELWQGEAVFQQSSGDAGFGLVGMMVNAVVTQIVASSTDTGYGVSVFANNMLLRTPDQGLLFGHRHPKYGTDLPK